MRGAEKVAHMIVRRRALVVFITCIAIGVPSVSPPFTPERIFTVSASLRGVTISLWPGRRRSSSRCTSASQSGMPGGQPSMTRPTETPWLSPQVDTRNKDPNTLLMPHPINDNMPSKGKHIDHTPRTR
jgi:hypothetical protein